MKQRYHHSKKLVNQVLTEAVSDPNNVANFRSTIMKCSLLHEYYLDPKNKDSESEELGRRKKYEKENKREARSNIRVQCGNGACTAGSSGAPLFLAMKKLQYCPCQKVGYVSTIII